MNKDLSIVVICIDPDKPILDRFLSSLRQYTTSNYELVVVNNAGSNRETAKRLEQEADKYVFLPTRLNVGEAWNKGIEIAEGNYILVTNDDVVLSRGWFEKMSSVFKEYQKVGMVVPVSNYSLIEQTHIGDIFHLDEACPIRLTPFKQFIWGVFMLFSKESLNEINKFAVDYDIAGGEDLDMCFRIFEAGMEIFVDHRVFVYHEWGSTGERILGDKARRELYVDNYRKFKKKWSKYTKDW